jgi:membrane peptidoglycan carboxypeptidase
LAGTNRRAAPPSRRTSSRVAAPSKRPRRFFDYPRQGYHGLHRWLPSWRFILGGFLTVCFLGLGAVVAAYAFTPIPNPAKDTSMQSSTVYYSNLDGTRGDVMGTFAVQRRQIVLFDTLPTFVGNAVVAGEDRTFWENSGFSITGTARALLNNLRGGSLQGGSTLTQQYAHRYYATRSTRADYLGKFKEAILAVKIARTQDKKIVLGNYLNTIYFGRDSYGIQIAAQSFFGVDASKLTISQSALLAGIVPSPNNWDPAKAPDKAEARWKFILDAMLTDKAITQAEHDDAVQKGMPPTIVYTASDTYKGVNGYILQNVRTELIGSGAFPNDESLDGGGLAIQTTIQKPVQDAAVASVNSLYDGTLAGAKPDPSLRVGVVSVAPATGAIISMYGGPDFLADNKNRVTYDAIQPGSTFKPFALIAALQEGIPLTTTFNGKTPQTFDGWKVPNFGNENFGNITLVTATAQSVNTVYAQLNRKVGPDKTAAVANKAGVTTPVEANDSNVLGTDVVHPLDMASAYATLAAQGMYSQPFIVKEVRYLKDNSVAYTGGKPSKQVFQPNVIADATYAMQHVVQDPQGTGHEWIAPIGRPIAGKTGTTDKNLAAWFVGFTPQISTAVAFSQVGANGKDQVSITAFGKDPHTRTMVTGVTGGSWPAALWASYMKPVLAMAPYNAQTPFPPRANVGGAPTPTVMSTQIATPTTPPVVTPPAPAQIAVPAGLAGMLAADAEAAVVNAGLQPAVSKQASTTVPSGTVIQASPAAGTMLDPQGTVALVISTGAPPPVVTPTSTPSPAAAR